MKVHLELLKFSVAAVSAGLLLTALWSPQLGCAQPTTLSTDSNSAMSATPAKPEAQTDATAKQAEDEDELAKAKHHGIQIHGHWVIDVKNPEGKLMEHREFENSLVHIGSLFSGDQLLAGLLSGNLTAGDPGIGLVQGTPGSDPSTFCNTQASLGGRTVAPNATCFGLATSASGMTSYLSNFTTGLTSTVTFSPKVSWVLSGNYTTPATLSSISAVQTLVATCFTVDEPFLKIATTAGGNYQSIQFAGSTSSGRLAEVAASQCSEISSPPNASLGGTVTTSTDLLQFVTLTSTNLATPLAVSPGQVITVTVTISFT